MGPLRYAAKFDALLFLGPHLRPPTRRNPRKGRGQILPSGNTVFAGAANGVGGTTLTTLREPTPEEKEKVGFSQIVKAGFDVKTLTMGPCTEIG